MTSRQIRAKLKLSRKQFAGRLGVHPRTVEGWENGRPPSKLAAKVMAGMAKVTS